MPSKGPDTFKVCFVGSEQAGKTALIIRLLFDEFEGQYSPTLEDSYRHSFVVGLAEHLVDIMDVSGSDVYQTEYERWFSWADAFVYVYNINEEDSLFRLRQFRNEIQRIKGSQGIKMSNIPTILVGTHLDEGREVTEVVGKKFAEALGCPFYETSSKVPINELSKSSSTLTLPSHIIETLIDVKVRIDQWKLLDTLEIPKKSATPDSPKVHKGSKPAKPVVGGVIESLPPEIANLTILDELREKWSRPIDKLPVYIDLPRLANKIFVEVNPHLVVNFTVKPAGQPPAAVPIVEPSNIGKSRSATTGVVKSEKEHTKSISKARSETEVRKEKKEKKEKSHKKEKKILLEDIQKKKKLISQPEQKMMQMYDEMLNLGTRVVIPSQVGWGKGTVRFKGEVKGENGICVGVELDKECGQHNGTVKGESYFTCPDRRGVIVRLNLVLPIFIKEPPNRYTGGTIQSNTGDSWVFDPSGTLSSKMEYESKPLIYEWDGETLKAKPEAASFGAGLWNAEHAIWYKKEWMLYRTSKREEFVKYEYHEEKDLYIPVQGIKSNTALVANSSSERTSSLTELLPTAINVEQLPQWIWMKKEKVLKSVKPGVPEVVWKTEGQVPKHVIIFLQMMRYVRMGQDKADVVISEIKETMDTPKEEPKEIQKAPSKEVLKADPKVPAPTKQSPPIIAPNNNNNTKTPVSPVNSGSQLQRVPSGGQVIKLNVMVNNWKFRIPISELATIRHLMVEISRRASKKLNAIEAKLEDSKTILDDLLSRLLKAVLMGSQEEAKETASVARLLVDAISDRVTEGTTVAATQTKEIEYQINQYCDELEDLKRDLVRCAANALRDPRNTQPKIELTEVIESTKTISAKLNVIQTNIQVLDLKTEDGADLDPEDKVGSVLNDESLVIAILEKKEGKHQSFSSNFLDDKKGRDSKKGVEKPIVNEVIKEEADQENKWNSLFASLAESRSKSLDSEVKDPKPTPPSSPGPQPQPGPSQAPGKKPFIGEVVRDVLCELSEKLEEHQQTEAMRTKFSSFVQQGGDTSRQLSKFLQNVLHEDSKLAKVLKAINQSIIATPFIRLKCAFPKEIPFEDVAGTWKIIVTLIPKQGIVITHKKSGQSKEGPPVGGFEFHWELIMKFTWDLSAMADAELNITSFSLDNNMKEANKKTIQKVLEGFGTKKS